MRLGCTTLGSVFFNTYGISGKRLLIRSYARSMFECVPRVWHISIIDSSPRVRGCCTRDHRRRIHRHGPAANRRAQLHGPNAGSRYWQGRNLHLRTFAGLGAFASVGIDPRLKKFLVLKSRMYFRSVFLAIAKAAIECNGVTSSDWTLFPYKKIRRPIFRWTK